MENIYDTDDKFPFDKLVLSTPIQNSTGIFFSKFSINNSPIYIQPPKCTTKSGFVKAGKKTYADLVFLQENAEFIRWIENLETTTQKIIYENREKWFETELSIHDIENSMTSPIKIYKSGKCYLVRVFIPNRLGKSPLKIYDENENDVNIEDINENNKIITILEVQGVKCSSKNFQIDIEVKQIMVLNPIDIFEKCLLKKNNETLGVNHNNSHVEPMSTVHEKNDKNITIDITNETSVSNDIHEVNKIPVNEEPEEQEYVENKIHTEQPIVINEITENAKSENMDDIHEINFNLEELPEDEIVQLKQRNEVYYKMYKEAKRKAKIAKDLALSSYLEAKRIKNEYMLDDSESDDDDVEYELNNLSEIENQN
jgi:hypothetical protein